MFEVWLQLHFQWQIRFEKLWVTVDWPWVREPSNIDWFEADYTRWYLIGTKGSNNSITQQNYKKKKNSIFWKKSYLLVKQKRAPTLLQLTLLNLTVWYKTKENLDKVTINRVNEVKKYFSLTVFRPNWFFFFC